MIINRTQKEQQKANVSIKHDEDKLRMDLIPPSALRSIAAVLTFGAKKYGPNRWQGIKPERYVAALLRHFMAYMENPTSIDEESGLLHIEHVLCNAVFLNELQDFKAQTEPCPTTETAGVPITTLRRCLDQDKRQGRLVDYIDSVLVSTQLEERRYYSIEKTYSKGRHVGYTAEILHDSTTDLPCISVIDFHRIMEHALGGR